MPRFLSHVPRLGPLPPASITPLADESKAAPGAAVDGTPDLVLQGEGGERRKAYFAAWSLIRDLAEDGVIVIMSEEGEGPRKKRTYRFATSGEATGRVTGR